MAVYIVAWEVLDRMERKGGGEGMIFTRSLEEREREPESFLVVVVGDGSHSALNAWAFARFLSYQSSTSHASILAPPKLLSDHLPLKVISLRLL